MSTDRQTTIDWIVGAAAAHLVMFTMLAGLAPPAKSSDSGSLEAAEQACEGLVVADQATDRDGSRHGFQYPASCPSGGQVIVVHDYSDAMINYIGGGGEPPEVIQGALGQDPTGAAKPTVVQNGNPGGMLGIGVAFGALLGVLGTRLVPQIEQRWGGSDGPST